MKTLKIIGCTKASLVGHIFECICIPGKTVIINGATKAGFKVISVMPSTEEPRIVKFQNSHVTITAEVIS